MPAQSEETVNETSRKNRPPTPGAVNAAPHKADTQLLLVDFRSGEPVRRHPDLIPYLQQGWTVRSAVPRIVETQGTKLLVVLAQPTPFTAKNTA